MNLDRLPPPVRILIAAGRHALGREGSECPSLTAAEGAALAEAAVRHGMVAWLPDVVALAPGAVDDVVCAQAVQRQAARSLAGIRDLLDLVGWFRTAGIHVVALKGPVFSAWLYGNPAARSFHDLDLLVPESARAAALDVLASIGYASAIPAGPAEVVYGSIGAWPLRRAGAFGVDVHWRLAGRRFARVLGPDEVIRDAIEVRIGTQPIPAPGTTHTAVLTLTHAAKHLWYALELPLSIAYLMERRDVNWKAVRDLMAGTDAIRPAAAGLRIASELFDVPVPEPFAADVATQAVDDLCACAVDTLALPPYVFPGRQIDRRIHRLCFERRTSRINYDLRRVLEPTHADWAWLPLPSSLAALYVPLRLVRLAGAGLRIWAGSPSPAALDAAAPAPAFPPRVKRSGPSHLPERPFFSR